MRKYSCSVSDVSVAFGSTRMSVAEAYLLYR